MLKVEKETEEYVLYSKELLYVDGSKGWDTWVYIKKDNFRIMQRFHRALEEKDRYVDSIRLELG